MGWVATNLLICMVVFCLLIQWGVVASILLPKSFVVLVVIAVIFMLSYMFDMFPTKHFWQNLYDALLCLIWIIAVWNSWKTNKFHVKNVFREIRQQKIYKPLSNHLKYVYRFDVKSFFNSEKCSNMINPFQIISGMSGFRFNVQS